MAIYTQLRPECSWRYEEYFHRLNSNRAIQKNSSPFCKVYVLTRDRVKIMCLGDKN
jgi:hypothetical protein